jgi:hypothetical protein
MSGLSRVLSICMGLSLGANTICLGYNMGGVNGFNVGDNSQRFFLSTFKKLIIIMHSLCNCLTQGHGIRHGNHKVFHISTKSKLKLAHEHNFIPCNVTC